MIFFKIALLNIRKHLKRSVLIIAAVAVSVVIMEFVGGMMDGMKSDFYSHLVDSTGHVQIHDAGYAGRIDKFSLKYLIDSPDEVIRDLLNKPNVVSAEKLIHFGALLIRGNKNLEIEGLGVAPDTRYYPAVRESLGGKILFNEPLMIFVSKRIALLLAAKKNDVIQVLVQDTSGSPYYLDFKIAGIFDSGSKEFDENNFLIRFDDASNLLDTGNKATEIRIGLAESGAAASFVKSIEDLLAKNGIEASTWEQIQGIIVSLIRVFDLFMLVINIFILIVAATVITNAILMNQFGRFREFGSMRSMGLKKRQLFSLIVVEGGIEGLFGSILGIALGIPLVLYFQAHGLRFGDAMEALGLSPSIRFTLTVPSIALNFILGALVSTIGSMYAAFVCTRMKLAENLKFL